MDLSQLSEFEIHQLLARLNEELARRHHVQLTIPTAKLESWVVQINFKLADKNPEEVYDELTIYGPIGLRQTLTTNGTVTMTVYYEDARDAENAVEKLRDRYDISLVKDPPNEKSDSRVVQVIFNDNQVCKAHVTRDLSKYGWIGTCETFSDEGTTTLKVIYKDARDAQDAVKV